MSFYLKLRKKLEKKIPKKELDILPRSYNMIGDILILKLKSEKHKKKIAKAVLDIIPSAKTIVLDKGITGIKRKPKIEILAGEKKTITLHKEHGAKFWIDISKTMWSKGNKFEKQRLMKLVKKNEIIVDMFSGLGYFSIILAKKAKKVYAIDINKDAIEFLERNVLLNKLNNVEILHGDCRKFAKLLENTADRIIMGYIYNTEKFLPYALKIAKKNAVIHFHRITKDPEKIKKKLEKYGKVSYRLVKTYAPNVGHYVFDIKLK
ncbi:MAG: class I SAM-dependent methyltransferase family protein [Candidatus Aenigmarchaeota archaeon]|nr:class I SAM-dependent methyltransferase family protein [Candidatus Aenigmarchaeota archaeon]